MMNDRPPIIRQFEIKGLYGYKDVSIVFDNAVRIVIAENGSGKTTILSALDAFLRGHFEKLRRLEFAEILCWFDDDAVPVSLTKNDVSTGSPVSANEVFVELVRYSGVSEYELIYYLTTVFDESLDFTSFRNEPIISNIFLESPYDLSDIKAKCKEALALYENSVSEAANTVRKFVREKLEGYEILYLPTYRRVEEPLAKQGGGRFRRNVGLRARAQKQQQTYSKINYGLEDVQAKLDAISDEIQHRTNRGYRQISATIIDDLLFERFDIENSAISDLPDLETLRRFFSRIEGADAGRVDRWNRIQDFYSNQGKSGGTRALIYFLSKLSEVVNQTNQLEERIEQFVKKANAYLGESSDAKKLIYDSTNMKVVVVSDWTGAEVKFDDLSSGEKQVVSLLSYLFLYDNKKIILIDEPELSLSIEWQQRILPDLVSSPLCSQMLAITHSPFIFDNQLDPCGGPLQTVRRKTDG